MIIQLGTVSKKANSTLRPGLPDSYDCKFKDGCDMVSPTVILRSSNTNYNYAFMNGRYYYINSCIAAPSGFLEITLECDVMATFKTQIGASTQFVERARDLKDGTMVDNLRAAKSDLVQTVAESAMDALSGCYIIGVRGASDTLAKGVKYYAVNSQNMNVFTNWLCTPTGLEAIFNDISAVLSDWNKSLNNVFDYLVSCMYIPFDVSGESESVKVGNVLSGAVGASIDTTIVKSYNISVPKHPQAESVGKYVNNSPYSAYKISLMGIGDLALPATSLLNTGALSCSLYLDTSTGKASWRLRPAGSATSITVGTYSGQIGVPIQLSQVISAGASFFQSALPALLPGNAVGGIANAMLNASPSVGSVGMTGSFSDILRNTVIMLQGDFLTVSPINMETEGNIYAGAAQIGSLSGYIKTRNAAVSVNGYAGEAERVAAIMDGGFYYE